VTRAACHGERTRYAESFSIDASDPLHSLSYVAFSYSCYTISPFYGLCRQRQYLLLRKGWAYIGCDSASVRAWWSLTSASHTGIARRRIGNDATISTESSVPCQAMPFSPRRSNWILRRRRLGGGGMAALFMDGRLVHGLPLAATNGARRPIRSMLEGYESWNRMWCT
jgi:hypothetical protein